MGRSSRAALIPAVAALVLAAACPRPSAPISQPSTASPVTGVVVLAMPSQSPAGTRATATPSGTPSDPDMAAPSGALLRAGGSVQSGAFYSYCWTGRGRAGCADFLTPSQSSALTIKRSDQALLELSAAQPPDAQTVRPYKDPQARSAEQDVAPGLVTVLAVELEPGPWLLDVCAAWNGHGRICWLFRLDVVPSRSGADVSNP